MPTTDHTDFIQHTIQQSLELKQTILDDPDLLTTINRVGNLCIEAFNQGKRILLAGNGGSAADAQHIAAEFVCRFNFDRPGLPAMALATNYSVITAAGNDYSFDDVFAREVQANGQSGDVFIGISTSCNSSNILRAVASSKQQGIHTVGLCGNGGILTEEVDHCICVPSTITPRIQECHILIGHILCEIVENSLFDKA